MKKYNFTYKNTCLITQKYYYGMHSTNNLNDGYFGSGKIINDSIKKYGKENHKFEILKFFESREELIEAEKKLITDEMISDRYCMNLRKGGDGGDTTLHLSVEEKKERIKKSVAWFQDPIKFEKYLQNKKKYLQNRSQEETDKIYKKARETYNKNKEQHGKKISEALQNRTDEQKKETAKKIRNKIKKSFEMRKENNEEWNEYINKLRWERGLKQGKPIKTPYGYFIGFKDAARKTGLSESFFRYRLGNEKFEDFYYVTLETFLASI